MTDLLMTVYTLCVMCSPLYSANKNGCESSVGQLKARTDVHSTFGMQLLSCSQYTLYVGMAPTHPYSCVTNERLRYLKWDS